MTREEDDRRDLGDLFAGMQVGFEVGAARSGWRVERRPFGRPVIHATLSCRPFGDCTVRLALDLSLTSRPRAKVLKELFDLSPAEARLAVRLAEGKTPRKIAEETGIAISTVRTHLKSVLAKTSTCRQTELIALFARIAVLFGTSNRSRVTTKHVQKMR